jgi:hypothetical protein
VEHLEVDEDGDYILGDWEVNNFKQLALKREKILHEDILDRGQRA